MLVGLLLNDGCINDGMNCYVVYVEHNTISQFAHMQVSKSLHHNYILKPPAQQIMCPAASSHILKLIGDEILQSEP